MAARRSATRRQSSNEPYASKSRYQHVIYVGQDLHINELWWAPD